MTQTNEEWIRITPATDIPPRQGRSVRLGAEEIAIFNLGERFVAFENRCPHRGGPLADGIVSSLGDSVTVTCPLHNWRVCVESGEVRKPSGNGHGCVRTYDVKVENGIVMLGPAIARKEAVAA